MAVQSLGWGRRGAAGTGGQRTGRSPSSSPSAPGAHHLPQEELEGEVVWDFCHHPNSAWMTPKVGLSIPLFSVHLTHRKAHQGHQEQGEQGRHGWGPEGRVGAGMWRAVGP